MSEIAPAQPEALDALIPLYLETEQTVRERLLKALPPDWATDEGLIAEILLSISVAELARLWEELNNMLRQMFIVSADGQYLDALGKELGCTRGTGAAATGRERFTGAPGTLIPAAAVVGVPVADPEQTPVLFKTTNSQSVEIPAAGFVDIDIVAEQIGAAANVPAGAITLLETNLLAEASISNPAPTVDGEDPQNDEEFRAELLARAELPVGSGTRADYVVWALEVPGVGRAGVTPLWDTSGSEGEGSAAGIGVAVAVRTRSYAPVDWSVVQAAQKQIDPSRGLLALIEDGEPWEAAEVEGGATLGWQTARRQAGESSLEMTFPAAGALSAVLTRALDLSRFASGDELRVWLYATDWSAVAATGALRLYTGAATYYELPLSTVVAGAPAKPASGAAWWEYRAEFSQAVLHGAEPASWDAISQIALRGVASAAVTLDWDYPRTVSVDGATGLGIAPVGAAVTISTPVSVAIDVEAALTLAAGYSIAGEQGTTSVTELLSKRLAVFLALLHPKETVRVNAIRDVIFNTPGVEDFVLAAPAANRELTVHQYAVLGALTLTA